MVIFGQQNVVAIEAAVEDVFGEKLWGQFFRWIDGRRLGQDICDWLGGPSVDVEHSISPEYTHFVAEHEAMEPVEVFKLAYDPALGLSQRNRPLLMFYGPPFDGWYVALIRRSDGDHFVWARLEESEIHEARVEGGAYDRVAREYLEWYCGELRCHGFPEDE